LSHPHRYGVGMKNRIKSLFGPKSERIVTTFGQARLVVLPDATMELRGGRSDDRTAAKEWISLFMHEAVLKFDN
jgi:hypothetical protein